MKNEIFEYKGYKCAVIFVNDSHYCGYVGVPKDHPAYGLEYYTFDISLDEITEDTYKQKPVMLDINDISVHGGLTFADNHVGRKDIIIDESENLWVFGFDAAHSGDKTAYTNFTGDVFRTLDYMTLECKKLADQLYEIETKYKG